MQIQFWVLLHIGGKASLEAIEKIATFVTEAFGLDPGEVAKFIGGSRRSANASRSSSRVPPIYPTSYSKNFWSISTSASTWRGFLTVSTRATVTVVGSGARE